MCHVKVELRVNLLLEAHQSVNFSFLGRLRHFKELSILPSKCVVLSNSWLCSKCAFLTQFSLFSSLDLESTTQSGLSKADLQGRITDIW